MARTAATNFSGPLAFPYATAATDLFQKEDVQVLAQAVDQHVHDGAGKGLQVAAIPASAIADGSIVLAKLAANSVDSSKIVDGTITSADIADGTIAMVDLAANAATRLTYAVGTTANPTTTSTAMVDMPEVVASLASVPAGITALAIVTTVATNATAGQGVSICINSNGTDVGVVQMTLISGGAWVVMVSVAAIGLLSGANTIKGRYAVNGSGTAQLIGVQRNIFVVELRR